MPFWQGGRPNLGRPVKAPKSCVGEDLQRKVYPILSFKSDLSVLL